MLTNRDSQCRALADLGKVIASAFAFEMKQAYMDVVMKDRDAWNFHELAAKGADMIADWLADGAEEDKEETAAADFARAFLGAGVVNQVAAYPFESVYTSPTRLVMQDAYEAVRQLYHKYGFVKSEDCDLHEDHIALEIQFLAHLSGRAAKLFEEGKEAEACDVLRLQKTFIETHIENWISRFCDDVRACPVSPFYKGWSYILEGFVFTLKGAIEDMLQECPS